MDERWWKSLPLSGIEEENDGHMHAWMPEKKKMKRDKKKKDGKEEDEERGALAIYSPGVRSPLAGMKN